jgi:hypothetical protein
MTEHVELLLFLEEVTVLRSILSCVGGSPSNSPRLYADSIAHKIDIQSLGLRALPVRLFVPSSRIYFNEYLNTEN